MAKKKSVHKTPKKRTVKKKKKTSIAVAPAQTEPPPGKLVVKTYHALSEIFGVKVSTIEKWRLDGMPGKKGHYVVQDIRQWALINGKGKKPSSEKDAHELSSDAEIAVAREQIAKADKLENEAQIIERKNRIEQGGLARQIDVERFITEFLTEARQLLQRMVMEGAAGYGPDLEQDLREDYGNRVDLVLNQLGDFIERMEDLEIID